MSIQYGSLPITDIKYCDQQGTLKNVSSVIRNGTNVWTKQQYQGLTFTFPTVGSALTLAKFGTPDDISLQYSVDNGSTWSEWNVYEGTPNRYFVSTVANQKLCVKGTTNTFTQSYNKYYYFNCDNNFYASGDARSLINYDDLTDQCFRYMFKNCTRLLSAPELNASVLAPYCYASMFIGCTSLTSAPSLDSVTTTEQSSCAFMFDGCSSLESASIPLAYQVNTCYSNMFKSCTSLTEITSSQDNFVGCANWFYGASSTGTFHCKPALATALTDGSCQRTTSTVPSGWTVIGDVI